MAEKLITLTESFRTLLRASYPSLADDIQGWGYFHSAKVDHTGKLEPEPQAAFDALVTLKGAIVRQSVRLYGRLGDNLPDDIDPTEVIETGILVFDNALEVWEPSTNRTPFRMLRTYRNVHCYAAEIAGLIAASAADNRGPNAKHPGGRPPEYEWVEIKLFFEQLLRERGDPMNEMDQGPGWKSIADVIRVISDHLQKQGKQIPEKTRFREVLNDVLSNHRRALAAAAGN
jgi:hypothetical protein